MLAAYRPVGYENWGLVARVETAEVFAPITRLSQMLWLLQAGALALGLVTSYLLARRFTRPIVRLAGAAEAVALGALTTRVEVALVRRNRHAGGHLQSHDPGAQLLVLACWKTASLPGPTSLARSEAVLRQQTRILQSILNSMGDGVVVCDEVGKFMIFNPAAAEILGKGEADRPPEEWSAHYGLYRPDRVTPVSGR